MPIEPYDIINEIKSINKDHLIYKNPKYYLTCINIRLFECKIKLKKTCLIPFFP